MAEESLEDHVDATKTRANDLMDIDVSSLASSVLARLVEEVRNAEPAEVRSYDRSHNRHNR